MVTRLPASGARMPEECGRQSVPLFFKQWGGLTPKQSGGDLDGPVVRLRPPGRNPAGTRRGRSAGLANPPHTDSPSGDISSRRSGATSRSHPAGRTNAAKVMGIVD